MRSGGWRWGRIPILVFGEVLVRTLQDCLRLRVASSLQGLLSLMRHHDCARLRGARKLGLLRVRCRTLLRPEE